MVEVAIDNDYPLVSYHKLLGDKLQDFIRESCSFGPSWAFGPCWALGGRVGDHCSHMMANKMLCRQNSS